MSRYAQSNVSSAAEWTGVLNEYDADTNDGGLNKNTVELKYANKRNYKLIWLHVFVAVVAHLGTIYGLYLIFTSAKILTTIYGKY